MSQTFQPDTFEQDAFQTCDTEKSAVLGLGQLGNIELGTACAPEEVTGFTGAFGQAQADIKQTYTQSGQANSDIKAVSYKSGQSQADIKAVGYAFGQGQAAIKSIGRGFGQAEADISTCEEAFNSNAFNNDAFLTCGCADGSFQEDAFQSDTFQECPEGATKYAHAQAQADIKQTYFGHGQANADIKQTGFGSGQAQAYLKGYGFGQSQADIKAVGQGYGQANAQILGATQQFAQAQGDILATGYGFGQANGDIKAPQFSSGQAQAYLLGYGSGQAQGYIKATNRAYGQALGTIKGISRSYGQANADIKATNRKHGQAQARIETAHTNAYGQAQAQLYHRWPIRLYDTFTRVVAGGDNAGTPDIGGPYDYTLGADSTINGSQLVQSSNFQEFLQWDALKLYDQEITWDFVSTEYPGFFNVYLRINGIEDFGKFVWIRLYNAGFFIEWDNFYNEEGTGDEGYNIPYGFQTGFHYKVKIKAEGELISIKTWFYEDIEPNEWLVELSPNFLFGIGPGQVIFGFSGVYSTGSEIIDNYMIRGPFVGQFAQAQATITDQTPVGNAQAYVGHFQWAQAQALVVTKTPNAQAQALVIGYTDLREDAKTYNFTDASNLTWFNDFNQWAADWHDPDPQNATVEFDFDLWNNNYPDVPSAIGDAPTGWLRFTLDRPQIVHVDTLQYYDYDHDTMLGIYTGDSGPGNWTRLAVSDDTDSNAESEILVALPAGEYLLFLGFFSWAIPLTAETHVTAIDFFGGFGQAQAKISTTRKVGQARAFIKKAAGYGQALAAVKRANRGIGQAQANVQRLQLKSGQAQAYIWTWQAFGQAMAHITTTRPNAQAQAKIEGIVSTWGQSQGYISRRIIFSGQARATVTIRPSTSAQAQGYIYRPEGYGQAQALIRIGAGYGQAQADIKKKTLSVGQAKATILGKSRAYALAQAAITKGGFGQAQALIDGVVSTSYGQAQAFMLDRHNATGYALAVIIHGQGYGQARARIFGHNRASGNANALIARRDVGYKWGQARAYINRGARHGQANALILPTDNTIPGGGGGGGTGGGGTGSISQFLAPQYIVNSNGYYLPGYAQSEGLGSLEDIQQNIAPYVNGSLSDYYGLTNKLISLKMKVVGTDYNSVKDQLQRATSIVRIAKGYTKLYLGRGDAYYEVLTKSIEFGKSVEESQRFGDYTVTWEAKPWLISDSVNELTGTGTITTDQVSRTYFDGGYTPATFELSGTNITVSGYSANGFTGYITVSGAVSNLTIDGDNYTSTHNGVNANNLLNPNYRVYVGPGKTIFVITGASSVRITYHNRWYL